VLNASAVRVLTLHSAGACVLTLHSAGACVLTLHSAGVWDREWTKLEEQALWRVQKSEERSQAFVLESSVLSFKCVASALNA